MLTKYSIRAAILSMFLFINLFIASAVHAEKTVVVKRESGPWMKTVFVDSFYGALLGGAGYGAYSLISKEFRSSEFGSSVGIGFFVGMLVGLFDASFTDSSALIQYNKDTHLFAFSFPQSQIYFHNNTGRFGGQVQVFNFPF